MPSTVLPLRPGGSLTTRILRTGTRLMTIRCLPLLPCGRLGGRSRGSPSLGAGVDVGACDDQRVGPVLRSDSNWFPWVLARVTSQGLSRSVADNWGHGPDLLHFV